MDIIKLTEEDLIILQKLAPEMKYSKYRNIIYGSLSFDLQFGENGKKMKDKYEIEIDLNKCNQGLPIVRETGKRIKKYALEKGIEPIDMHINGNDEMCLIIPPKIKEKYPNGFDIKILIMHIQEHLYYISYIEKYNCEPWEAYGHGNEGYLELYFEDKEKYKDILKEHFNCASRPELRRKIKELRRLYQR